VKRQSVYNVYELKQSMKIDANWDKPQWNNVKAVDLTNYMGSMPSYKPSVHAKLMYDDNNIYVIFNVKDRYVRCITKDINGPVWEDSCVEFFFAPDTGFNERYFNLEINCGGTPLMHYNTIAKKQITELVTDDIKKIEIAHSLPQIVDPEISEPVTWTLEYRIPLVMLEKYSRVTNPKPGINWRANFFKIAENNSNPHYLTWSVLESNQPDFHLPQYFGLIKFQ
jgi:hypothetical protein